MKPTFILLLQFCRALRLCGRGGRRRQLIRPIAKASVSTISLIRLVLLSCLFLPMKSSWKLSYGSEKNKASALTTVTAKAGDVNFKASMSDATFSNGPSLTGLALAVEKPGSFSIDFDVPKKDFKFRFMNSIRVAEKPLNLTYTHNRADSKTLLDGTLVFDSANKISGNYVFGTADNFKLKYTYVHAGATTFEPSFDFAGKYWDFMLSHKIYGDDVVNAKYNTSNRVMVLDWSRNYKPYGSFKISATIDLKEQTKTPKLLAESSWSFG